MIKCPGCGGEVEFKPGQKQVVCQYCGTKFDPEEKAIYLEELGVSESGLDNLIKEAYDLLGLATFFTAGEKEVRAWTFKKGMNAKKCAGIIHTDFEKGFIRAEVMSFEDLQKHGSELIN